VVRDASADSLHGLLKSKVQVRSTVLTDDWRNCPRMDQKGFEHLALRRGPHAAVRCQLFPWVHITLSNLKRFLLGTHHKIVP
jgi:transposase-like protein